MEGRGSAPLLLWSDITDSHNHHNARVKSCCLLVTGNSITLLSCQDKGIAIGTAKPTHSLIDEPTFAHPEIGQEVLHATMFCWFWHRYHFKQLRSQILAQTEIFQVEGFFDYRPMCYSDYWGVRTKLKDFEKTYTNIESCLTYSVPFRLAASRKRSAKSSNLIVVAGGRTKTSSSLDRPLSNDNDPEGTRTRVLTPSSFDLTIKARRRDLP